MTALIDHAQQVWDIPGGIHPAEHKELSNQLPIQPAPLPARLILPLSRDGKSVDSFFKVLDPASLTLLANSAT